MDTVTKGVGLGKRKEEGGGGEIGGKGKVRNEQRSGGEGRGRGTAKLRRAKQPKEGGGDSSPKHESVAGNGEAGEVTAEGEQVGRGNRIPRRAGKAATLGPPDPHQDIMEAGHGIVIHRKAEEARMIGRGGEVDLDRGVGKKAVSQSGDEIGKREVGDREGRKAVEGTELEIGRPTRTVGRAGGRGQGMMEEVSNGGP